MNVSRETSTSFLEQYKERVAAGPLFVGFDDVSLLSLLVRAHRGSCLVVEDMFFDVVFNVLYRSGLGSFAALTDLEDTSPVGFSSPLQISKNAFSLYKNNLNKAILLSNKSFFTSGSFKDRVDEVFCNIDSSSTFNYIKESVFRAGLVQSSVVVSPGTYAERGCVYDLFPHDSPVPIRVDFSFDNDIKIYEFDVNTQLTKREISCFVFKVSDAGFCSSLISNVIGNLPVLSVGVDYLKCKNYVEKINITCCNYEFYLKNKGFSVSVDPELESVGVVLGDVFFVPPWFKKTPSSQALKRKSSFLEFDNFSNINIGDYLIHEDFGVGQFLGIVCDDNDNDQFVSLKFFDGVVSVDVGHLSVLSFYESGDLDVPLNSISKKGVWKRRVSGVSKKINHFVSELLTHHVQRIAINKKRGKIDMGLLMSFVSSFKYNDTKDQVESFNDILSDLKSPEPMDRLLCGDVGFGKTEIAIRAVFASLLMGGRVVVLAPTTVLCYQLFKSFSSRLKDFPVNVKMVSRLVSDANVVGNIDLFNRGRVDVLICTQRIFFHVDAIKSLSMLVVDEEHRFGVQQKEVFFNKFPRIDVLSMSATPIPRSLQQAFSGIKTISTITTPPYNRRPIQTSVMFFDLKKIVQNILFELSRGGQVYFLHNNISSIDRVKRMLVDKIDGLKVDVISGKMVPSKIESVLNSFVLGEFDVLISTSIIESGLDIPNVNTIIINNAHLFGLSQLHQIRGRVGRYNRQAFSFLLIPRGVVLKKNSLKRLKTIEENVALGSGYNIASKDLEIRGAGSVFGYAQSGGSSVGFDLYNKLLAGRFVFGEASVLKEPLVDVFNEKPCFPTSYIKEDVLRLSLYKKLSNIKTVKEVFVFKEELLDRFGVLPVSVSNLISTQHLRVLASMALVSSVFKEKNLFSLVFLPGEHIVDVGGFLSFLNSFFNKKKIDFSLSQKSGNRVVLSFSVNNYDICIVLTDLLNKFIGVFLGDNK